MSKEVMTGSDLAEWQRRMDLSDRQAIEVLGLGSRVTLQRYRENGAPLYIALACAAVAAKLPPWTPATN